MLINELSFTFLNLIGIAWSRNVLLMIADDAGLETPVYGNSKIKTPHIDHLARNGLVFDSAFATVSSCSPSRSAILTGLPIHQNGMYGLHHGYHHYDSFTEVQSICGIARDNEIRSGIVGKKHVGPESVYEFDYEQTEEQHSIMQVGRNITLIKEYVREFLAMNDTRPFFLYVGFHDPHRCGHTHPEYGQFCEKFGNGDPGMGTIPDWSPDEYEPGKIKVPYFVPKTSAAREDLAAQYTTISRLDQGIGLVINELESAGFLNDTLIIYSSDNGIPFPSGRTNFYDSGIQEPLIISSPLHPKSHGLRSPTLASHLDIVPTILDWFNLTYPTYYIFDKKRPVHLTGRTLLPLMQEGHSTTRAIFSSHVLHESTMYYPMRAVRTDRYKLIHNLEYKMPFLVDQDLYISKTYQSLLNMTVLNKTIPWYKTLKQYFYRSEWELFDLKHDPQELKNVVLEPNYRKIFEDLRGRLVSWQNMTSDPWLCSPHGILQDSGIYINNPRCFPIFDQKVYYNQH